MPSIIFASATRFLISLLLLLPLFLFLRGHNEPGGGFVAGLVAAGAISLYALAFNVDAARRMLRIDPQYYLGIGISMSTLAGVLPMVQGKPFLTGVWAELVMPGFPSFYLGTPILFDLGVFVTVLGVSTAAIFALMEED